MGQYQVYSDTVRRYFEHPENAGDLDSGAGSTATGAAGEKRENIGQINITLDPPIDAAREERVMNLIRDEIENQK